MSKKKKNHQVYNLKKGEIYSLDSIYEISGLFIGGAEPWWEPIPDPENDGRTTSGETVQIQRDIIIEIIER